MKKKGIDRWFIGDTDISWPLALSLPLLLLLVSALLWRSP